MFLLKKSAGHRRTDIYWKSIFPHDTYLRTVSALWGIIFTHLWCPPPPTTPKSPWWALSMGWTRASVTGAVSQDICYTHTVFSCVGECRQGRQCRALNIRLWSALPQFAFCPAFVAVWFGSLNPSPNLVMLPPRDPFLWGHCALGPEGMHLHTLLKGMW